MLHVAALVRVYTATALAFIVALTTASALRAEVPGVIRVQGNLEVKGNPHNATAYLKFALVDTTATETYWSHDGTSSAGSQPTGFVEVPVTDGMYSVKLGDTSIDGMTEPIPVSVFENAKVFLVTWASTDGKPFQATDVARMTASGYALNAATAESVKDGVITASSLASGSVTSDKLADQSITSAKLASNLSLTTTGTITAGSFIGNGSGLTGLNAANLAGTVPDARLSGNVALLNSSPTFSGGVTANAFAGDGSGLTGLNAANLSGTVLDARLSSNVALLSGSPTFSGEVTATSFKTSGGINVDSGTLFVDSPNDRVGIKTSSPSTTLDVNGTIKATSFSGDGSGLTGVSAANLAGTIADARLSSNVPLLNGSAAFTAAQTFSGAVTLSNNLNVDGGTLSVDAANNRVGIGSTSPVQMLDLVQTDGSDVAIRLGVETNSSSASTKSPGETTSYVIPGIEAEWSGAGNVQASDDVYASASKTSALSRTGQLQAKDFGFSLPTSAVIQGISVAIEDRTSAAPVTRAVILYGEGLSSLKTQSYSDTSEAVRTLGSSTDLWNNSTLTPSVVNSSSFTVKVAYGGPSGSWVAEVDSITMTIYYTVPQFTLGLDASESEFVISNGSDLSTPLLSVTSSGTVTATSFVGDASQLTSLNASSISSGTLSADRVPSLDAVKISTGTLADARLSSNVALLSGSPTFTGAVTASSFSGSGASLTSLNAGNISGGTLSADRVANLDASKIASGTLADARLSSNVALLGSSPTFTGTVTANSFSGSGASLTGLNAGNISSGTLADARLSANVPLLNGSQTFTGSPTFSGIVSMSNMLTVDSGTLAVDAANNRVGIGTTSPAAPLDVSGSSVVRGGLLVDANGVNNGTLSTNSAIVFGPANSGQGIAAKLTSGGNRYGLDLFTGAVPRLSIDFDGDVGIGTTSPTARLDVNGTVRCTSLTETSDRNLKKDIVALENVLDTVMALRPVTYRFKDQADNEPTHTGLIAQDVQELFPEAVTKSGDHLSVSYTAINVAAIKALQELKREKDADIELLKSENASLKAENAAMQKRLEAIEKLVSSLADERNARRVGVTLTDRGRASFE